MTKHNSSGKGIINSVVPIARFNFGEASRIFEGISDDGFVVVMKGNDPVCVLLKPKRYEAMIELLEDYALFFKAENRMTNVGPEGFISIEQVLNDLGISESDIENVDLDLE